MTSDKPTRGRPRLADPSRDAMRKRRQMKRRRLGLVSVQVDVPKGDETVVEALAARLRRIAKRDG